MNEEVMEETATEETPAVKEETAMKCLHSGKQ